MLASILQKTASTNFAPKVLDLGQKEVPTEKKNLPTIWIDLAKKGGKFYLFLIR